MPRTDRSVLRSEARILHQPASSGRQLLAAVIVSFALASCSSSPKAESAPAAAPAPVRAVAEQPATTTAYVTASTLNVRREPAATAAVVGKLSYGDQVAVVGREGEWASVTREDGASGWVSMRYLADAAPSRGGSPRRSRPAPPRAPSRPGCPADSDYTFVKNPPVSFSEQTAHGLVVVEATVDARGEVSATRVVSNSTGDPRLARQAEKEIREARFAPPIRNCQPRSFFFTYRRTF